MRIRKLRGGKRYYARMRDEAARFSVGVTPDHWYDLWHMHFDRRGYGLRRPRVRAQHLTALFAAFRRAVATAEQSACPVQVFVSIAPPREAGQDALYVHSPNPNGTPFPHPFTGAVWGVPPPALLRPFIDTTSDELGALDDESGRWWVVRPRVPRITTRE